MTDLPDPDDLSLANLDATSQHADWRDHEFHEWQYWDAVRVEDGSLNREVWVYPDDQDEYREHTGYSLWEICEGPMMNYAYDLNGLAPYSHGSRSPSEAAALLAGLPLCIVQAEFLSGDWHLALTGGGMDLSWEIAQSYIRLGFLPPTEFADLPRMAGRGESEKDRKIIEACKRSFRAEGERATAGADRLENNFGAVA